MRGHLDFHSRGPCPMVLVHSEHAVPTKRTSKSNSNGSRKRVQALRTPVERFINVLTTALVVNKMSQRELSERIGVTIGTLTKYLRGEVGPTNCKAHIQEKLAELRGVSLDSLLNYYRTGEFDDDQAILKKDAVIAWLKSNAGQEDLLELLEAATTVQKRMIDEQFESLRSRKNIQPAKWDDARSAAYGQALRETFEDLSIRKGLSEWDAWADFRTMKELADKPQDFMQSLQLILSDKAELTGEQMTYTMNLYGDCPGRIAMEEWATTSLPELKQLCHASAA